MSPLSLSLSRIDIGIFLGNIYNSRLTILMCTVWRHSIDSQGMWHSLGPEHLDSLYLNFGGATKLLYQAAAPFYILTGSILSRAPFLHTPANTSYFPVLKSFKL